MSASAAEPTTKRPKLRTAAGAATSASSTTSTGASTFVSKQSTSVSSEYLRDFCRAFLQDEEMNIELNKLIHCRKDPLSNSRLSPTLYKKSLPFVPLQFENSKQYLQVFQTLMVEEAKAELFSHLSDNLRRIGFELMSRESEERDDDSCYSTSGEGEPTVHCRLRASVRLPERHKKDWREAEAEQIRRIQSDAKSTPCGLSQLQRGDVLILLHSHMAKRPAGYYETDSRFMTFGVVSRSARPVPQTMKDMGGVEIEVAVPRSCAEKIRNIPVTAYVVEGCNVVTSWREWDGMNALFTAKPVLGASWSSPLLPCLLSGGSAHNTGPSTLSSAKRNTELIELNNVATVDPNMPLGLPGATPFYQSELLKRYNASQIEAIAAASTAKNGFVLVQGPPGTGKTHTLLALLNSLHLSVCQQCYERDLPDPFKSDNPVKATTTFDWLRDKSNPHLLVVAPSNAAIDNVLRLVLTKGFLDGVGNRYVPQCVRIGSSNWNMARNQDDLFSSCSLDTQVDNLMKLRNSYADAKALSDTDSLTIRLKGMESEVRRLSKLLAELANEHAVTRSPEKLSQFHHMAGEWVAHRNRARDLALDLERRRLLFSQPTGGEGLLRGDMRALVLSQANLVFATLSQCGSPAMTEIAPSRVRFQVCVVDEAAQAVEPSTLVPLCLGVERCVMVGDPNQLPATVLSEDAARARYQQSLFERLQRCGHAVHLLNTQYRCRPELSSFCSKTFYADRLQDGENVLKPNYALPMYKYQNLGPLVFFDVAFGSHVRSTSTSSLSNGAEADICLNLYLTLRDPRLASETVSPLTQKPCHIAVISPYREQLSLLQSRFLSYAQHDKLLEMNTVDGFQGREVDIVIFSCVRAHAVSPGSSSESGSEEEDAGIGFLNDARRLNVAATRARFALLIVGNYQVLERGSRLWRGLLEHTQRRGRVVKIPESNFDFLA